jgi:hypothetical protein
MKLIFNSLDDLKEFLEHYNPLDGSLVDPEKLENENYKLRRKVAELEKQLPPTPEVALTPTPEVAMLSAIEMRNILTCVMYDHFSVLNHACSESFWNQCEAYCRDGDKIQLIKLVRSATLMGLKECKELVEECVSTMHWNYGPDGMIRL